MSLWKNKQTISEVKEMYKERLMEILKEINYWNVDVFYEGEKGKLGIYEHEAYRTLQDPDTFLETCFSVLAGVYKEKK